MFLDNKIPFQFGDPRNGDFIVFNCSDLGLSYRPRVKTERTKSALFDGEARLNGDERNKLDDTVIKLSFSLPTNSRYTQDYILGLFSNTPRKFFVWEEGIQEGISVQRVLWQYAECSGLPQVFSGINEQGAEYKRYDVDLILANPEFYEGDETLSYFTGNQTLYKFTDPEMFEFLTVGSIEFGSYEINSFPAFSNLTNTGQQYEYLQGDLPLSVLDKYFRVEDYSVSAGFTQTLTSTPLFTTTAGLDLATSRPSYTYSILLDALSQNQFIQVTNLTTDSDLKITWLDAVANPNDLLFISVDNLLYDPVTQNEIDPSYYEVDSDTNTPLFFSHYLQSSNNPNLLIQRDTDDLMLHSTATNQITLQTLKAFI